MERTEEVDYGPTTSSKQPSWELVPRKALLRVVKRFEMGQERKGAKAWNGRSNNQDCLLNRDFVASRVAHVINHAYALLDKMEGRIEDDGDDDAAAIAWGGIFLCEVTDALKAAKNPTKKRSKSKK